MWQVKMFNSLEELNKFLKNEKDIIKKVKEYRHKHILDFYPNGLVYNEYEEFTVLVKMREVR